MMLAEAMVLAGQRKMLRERLEREPDLNLYLLAFECPDLEEAALSLARELETQE